MESNQHSAQVLWQEICRAYSGELIPYEVAEAKRELDGLVEQVATYRAALEEIASSHERPMVTVLGMRERAREALYGTAYV